MRVKDVKDRKSSKKQQKKPYCWTYYTCKSDV